VSDYPRVEVNSRAEWRAWLEANHSTSGTIWLVRWKKSVGEKYIPYDEMVEEALCFGWIDSVQYPLDEQRALLRMSPRRKGSGWSKLNKDRVKRLTRAGLMTPAGLAAVNAAKKDGSWMRHNKIEAMGVPADLGDALARAANATTNFAAFPPSAKRGLLAWLAQAKRPETRARRLQEIVKKAATSRRP
jgi:uncharacterized protein YdeI (YjbR/CyaY-like superfamily)